MSSKRRRVWARPEADPHDEPVTASTTGPPGPVLPALRRLTWWVTAACLLLIAALVAGERSTVLTLVAVAGACTAAGVLFASAVLGRPVLRPVPQLGLVAVGAVLAAALLVLSGTAGFPWPLPLAAVLAAAHAAGVQPWRITWPAGLGLAFVASLLG